MILRVIHPLFKLDLEDKGLTLIEENSWFNDRFFTKYTYPFDFESTDELDAALQHITKIERASTESVYDVIFLVEGKRHDAQLLIDITIGRRLSPSISYGFEELPNWNKKLADLPLESFTPSPSIYDLAESYADLSWPTVNFCFPQVIPPEGKYDTDTDQWAYFEGFINNRVGSAFLQNEYDTENDLQINRNVMQPMPYLLYVLQQGFADAGYELAGDILQDPELQKAFITCLSDYYTSINEDAENITKNADEYYEILEVDTFDNVRRIEKARYANQQSITEPGRYVISGNVVVRTDRSQSAAYLYFNEEEIFRGVNFNRSYNEEYFSINETVEVFFGETGVIDFESYQLAHAILDGEKIPDALIFDLSITKITEYNEENEAQPTLLTPSEVKLNRCVPDMTFGDLFNAIRNYRNYDLRIVGDQAFVNKIEKELVSRPKVNLKAFEVREPRIKNNGDRSYLLKFQDIDNDLFDHPPVYVDRLGSNTEGYVKSADTTEIVIDLAPMPNNSLKGISTAQMISDDKNKLQLGLYSGLIDGKNAAENPRLLGLLNSYDKYYKNWLDFRFKTRTVEWTFKCTPEVSRQVTAYSEIQAYNSRFIPERVSKKILSKEEVEITLEVDKLV
ncbi:hypothetical protein [Leeuwenhoekiella marinoflava]|uniref:Uncharacterized protein n=2 Tax=Leeuwenhoekiella marinoflava TaxID=988 RepID=A0A4Q0PNE4_9FLAO|nr:hypothetical protein [Leeuwenhoekiella marinoflava]RXG32069.1 hypothetical protein DSL99_1374 [Leeuwenhoekiella marinoflava]SHE96915.1 hypothetical protein SAMN02745246_01429 [Leeuwenhoekiella marinoflava DSM 3653]